jgi:RimJ/RimL family protein N-acetyltransferase
MSNSIKPVTWETPVPILVDLPDELNGPRVVVRPYRAGDGVALFEAVDESREHLEPWLPWGPKHKSALDSEACVRRFHAGWLTREDLTISIWERESGRFVGGAGLHRINWNVPSFEIGYWLRKSAERQGYMTETVRLLMGLAFETLKANRLYVYCATENVRSNAIPKRLGFAHEGTLRNCGRNTRGELYDINVYAMTPSEFTVFVANENE